MRATSESGSMIWSSAASGLFAEGAAAAPAFLGLGRDYSAARQSSSKDIILCARGRTDLQREHVFLEELVRAADDGGLDAVLRAPGGARQLAYPLRERVVLRERLQQSLAHCRCFRGRALFPAVSRSEYGRLWASTERAR